MMYHSGSEERYTKHEEYFYIDKELTVKQYTEIEQVKIRGSQSSEAGWALKLSQENFGSQNETPDTVVIFILRIRVVWTLFSYKVILLTSVVCQFFISQW